METHEERLQRLVAAMLDIRERLERGDSESWHLVYLIDEALKRKPAAASRKSRRES